MSNNTEIKSANNTEIKSANTMILSRLIITGYLHEETPRCVINEIIDAHGIIIDSNFNYSSSELINKIYQNNNVKKIDLTQVSNDDYRLIARFVNKNILWPKRALIQAFNFMMLEYSYFTINDNTLIGPQIPENINSYNACMLYKLCKDNNITCLSNHSINDMFYLLLLLDKNKNQIMKELEFNLRDLSKYVTNDNRSDLVNVIAVIKNSKSLYEKNTKEIDYNKALDFTYSQQLINSIHAHIFDIKILQYNMSPSFPEAAIALCAVLYNLDISFASDPINEFKYLKMQNNNPRMTFEDKWMNYWHSKNPLMFKLYCYFNPLIPNKFYNDDMINELLNLYGYFIEDRGIQSSSNALLQSSNYTLLQSCYLENNFYLGPLNNMKTHRTLINLDDVSDIKFPHLLCWGTLNNSLDAITVSELKDLFLANMNFSNPFDISVGFSKYNIKSLLYLCNIYKTEEYLQLRSAIEKVEFEINFNDKPTLRLKEYYKLVNDIEKENIATVLYNLLYLGMYMRGWLNDNVKDFPVKQAIVALEHINQVESKVFSGISKFEESLKHIRKPRIIEDLPLVKWKSNEYYISNTRENGLTIIDRINIVKEGDTSDNIASCIRISSNWICSSAHKYLSAIDKPPFFDIKELRTIS
jgi:hypothetical protein